MTFIPPFTLVLLHSAAQLQQTIAFCLQRLSASGGLLFWHFCNVSPADTALLPSWARGWPRGSSQFSEKLETIARTGASSTVIAPVPSEGRQANGVAECLQLAAKHREQCQRGWQRTMPKSISKTRKVRRPKARESEGTKRPEYPFAFFSAFRLDHDEEETDIPPVYLHKAAIVNSRCICGDGPTAAQMAARRWQRLLRHL